MIKENEVALVGTITKSPVLRQTKTGKLVCSFDINLVGKLRNSVTGENGPHNKHFRITVWDKLGEEVNANFKEGQVVYIEGKIEVSIWKGDYDLKRESLGVIASLVEPFSREVISKIGREYGRGTVTTT